MTGGRKRTSNPPIKRRVIKLQGGEVPTASALERADEFAQWFTDNREHIESKWIYSCLFDEDILHDTYCRIHEAISLKGTIIGSNMKSYFLQAYHRTRLNSTKHKKRNRYSLSDPAGRDREDLSYTRLDRITDTSPEAHDYADVSDRVEGILDYVRAKYEPAAASLFEMYVFLQPDISYRKLANITGVGMSKIWPAISKIRADLQERFGGDKMAILTDSDENLSL